MRRLTYLALGLLVFLPACNFDNYSEPESMLEGRVVYNNEPIGVRQNGVRLELWQDGWQDREEISVYVHHDGTFSAALFDGEYKLVRKQNNGPWVNNSDTIRVQLDGSLSIDVPVEPYYVITNDNVSLNGTKVTATFNVQKVAGDRAIERVMLFVGRTTLVDTNYNLGRPTEKAGAEVVPGTPVTLEYDLGAAAQEHGQVFARVGVKVAGVEEMLYTQVKTLDL